jgi:hypothetical protein
MPITVAKSPDILRRATGFWSGKEVMFNPSAEIVLLDSQLTPARLLDLLHEFLCSNLANDICSVLARLRDDAGIDFPAFVASRKLKSYLKTYEAFASFLSQHDVQCRPYDPISELVASTLRENYTDEESQLEVIASSIAKAVLADSSCIRFDHNLNSHLVLLHPFLIKSLEGWSERNQAIEHVLESIATAAWSLRFSKDQNLSKQVIDGPEKTLRPFVSLGLQAPDLSNKREVKEVLAFSKACRYFLGLLVQRGWVLLPPMQEMHDVMAYEPRYHAFEHGSHDTMHRSTLRRLLASSTVVGPDDVPANVREWVRDVIPIPSTINGALMPVLRDHALRNKLKQFPLALLNGLKAKRNAKPHAWSPNWLRDQGVPKDWILFAELLAQASESSDGNRGSMLRRLLEWAWFERRMQTPADIAVTDLRNPHHPDRADTLFHHIRNKKEVKRKAEYWASAASAFRLVHNLAKVTGNCSLLRDNPFHYLDNPFTDPQNYKTFRKRLPENMQEAMIDVLLSPDSDGVPTYDFVKHLLKWDWYKVQNQATGLYEKVWCPSRANCVALLLMLPLRGKQARWLDEGLLDSMIWDIDSDQFVQNAHPLSGWRYPNGSAHQDVYRRNSGVLQPLTDPFAERQQLGIFVSTNKTQMWDPAQRVGHEIHWPRGDELACSTEAALREQAAWLRRPYNIIEAQRRWLAIHDPYPQPVTFTDAYTDDGNINGELAERYPYFTPLFRDLSSPHFRADGAQIHIPVSPTKLGRLLSALALEVEKRLSREGVDVTLTIASDDQRSHKGRACIVDIHSLRVAGISRMIEIGVPVHIIQECIVGHQSLLMTLHYEKHTAEYVKSVILSATRNAGRWINWDAKVADALAKQPSAVVTNPRFRESSKDTLIDSDIFIGWKAVDGGMCPMGGTACDIGGIVEYLDSNGKKQWGPVVGGCGNCRFFCTGPAFVVQQAQALNEIMLQMRSIGKQRKELYEKLDLTTWHDTDIGNRSAHGKELHRLQEAIQELDRRLEPLILEWYNRYMALDESNALLAVEPPNGPNTAHASAPTAIFISMSTADDIAKEVEVRAERAGDFALVRQILEAAMIRGGLEKASELPKVMMREFMDRILALEGIEPLLVSLANERERTHAAFLLAETLSAVVGDAAIQAALDTRKAITTAGEDIKHEICDALRSIRFATKSTTPADGIATDAPERLMILDLRQ